MNGVCEGCNHIVISIIRRSYDTTKVLEEIGFLFEVSPKASVEIYGDFVTQLMEYTYI